MKLKLKHIAVLFALFIVKASAMESAEKIFENLDADLNPEIQPYKQVADVCFEIQRLSFGGMTLIGKEKGVTKFNYKVSNCNSCSEYTSGNFAITKLGDELRWRYMSPDEKFCEVSVNSNGDMELIETPQTNTNSGMFLFKTDGTLVNRGNQAFSWLVLYVNQFHNYGTLQTWSHSFWYSYSFNSGVIKTDGLPSGIADLRTPEMKNSTAKPNYRHGIMDNYGKKIYSGTLKIKGALSQDEHGESVFQNLEMEGGDIVVNGGSMNISGKLSGTVRNMSSTCQGSLYVNEYDATRTGNYFAAGGSMYTTAANCNNLAQYAKDLNDEQRLLEKFQNARRVTPEQAYERYQLIKQGKKNLVYSRATMNDIKKAHPNDWREIAAMKNWGLPGGGGIETVVVGAALGYGADRLFNRHHHRATVRATIGIDHRGNIAGGFNNQSVDWQLRQQRRMQDNHTRQVQESFSSNQISLIRRANPSHVYWKELEAIPQKIKLAKELQDMFKPVNTYNSWNHKSYVYGTCKYLDNPLNIIKNAYNMKVDTTQYWANRNYYSRLYKSLRDAQISHRDILAVVGNPYLGVVKNWNNIAYSKKQALLNEHPEIPELSAFLEKTKSEFRASNPAYRRLKLQEQRVVDEGIEDMSFWFIPALPAKIPAGLKVAFATFSSKVPQIAGAYSRKPEFVQDFINFFKKKTNDGFKKGTDSNALKPRIQNTPQEVMDYIKGLTDKKGYILNRGKTKDGYHYYEVMKKFEYKGIKFQKGEYISRDTRHHEIEYFRNKNTHIGALDPVKGNLKPKSRKPERKLHI